MSNQPTPPPLPPRRPPTVEYGYANYAQPPVSAAQTLKWMGIGLGVGSLISALLWIPIWAFDKQGNVALPIALVVLGIKFVGGVVGLCFAGWRALGGGVLLSIAIGFLIFFGACAANLNMH